MLFLLTLLFAVGGCGLRQIVETDLEGLHSPRLFYPNSSPLGFKKHENDPMP
jgi:hypothetical protein